MNKTIIALIGIIPATLTAIFGYVQGTKATPAHKAKLELEEKSLVFKNGANPNFKELVYPNYGLSLLAPVSWLVEDSPARLAGGEFNLIQRYDDTKAAIGVNFRLRPVQPNYINDVGVQVQNQLDVLQKNYAPVTVSDKSVSGIVGKAFDYEMPTGKRRMRVRMLWLRVVPSVQLQIQAAQYTDAQDRDEFWNNVDQMLSSIVIALDAWQARQKGDLGI